MDSIRLQIEESLRIINLILEDKVIQKSIREAAAVCSRSLKKGNKIIPGNWVTVTVEDNPRIIGKKLDIRDFESIKSFIKMNRRVILQYWDSKISTKNMLNNIKPIKYL
jgi:hypothetical protein